MVEHKRKFTAAEKAKIIREGMASSRPITELCRQYGITATQYRGWQRRALSGMIDALEKKPTTGKHDLHATALSDAEEKIAELHRVIIEISLEKNNLNRMFGG